MDTTSHSDDKRVVDDVTNTDVTDTNVIYDKLKKDEETLDEYVDNYYKIKNEYETRRNIAIERVKNKRKKNGERYSNAKIRKNLEELNGQHTCVNCSRKVGMFFSEKNNQLVAKCGSSVSPCNLKIIINKGSYYPYEKIIHGTMDQVGILNEINTVKLMIIRMKLDMVFEFENVRDTLKKFNIIKEELSSLYHAFSGRSDVHNIMIDKYDSTGLLKMELKRDETIHTIKRMITDYDTKGDAEKKTIKRSNFFLKLADIYIYDLNTLINSINHVKYNVYDVETTHVKNEHMEHRFVKSDYSYTDTLMQEDEFSIISNVHGRPTE
jgi:hypothetical protein